MVYSSFLQPNFDRSWLKFILLFWIQILRCLFQFRLQDTIGKPVDQTKICLNFILLLSVCHFVQEYLIHFATLLYKFLSESHLCLFWFNLNYLQLSGRVNRNWRWRESKRVRHKERERERERGRPCKHCFWANAWWHCFLCLPIVAFHLYHKAKKLRLQNICTKGNAQCDVKLGASLC